MSSVARMFFVGLLNLFERKKEKKRERKNYFFFSNRSLGLDMLTLRIKPLDKAN